LVYRRLVNPTNRMPTAMASLLTPRVSTSAAKRFGWHGVRRGAAKTVPRVGSGGLGGHFGPQEGGGEMEPGSGNIAEEQIVKEVMEKGYVRSIRNLIPSAAPRVKKEKEQVVTRSMFGPLAGSGGTVS